MGKITRLDCIARNEHLPEVRVYPLSGAVSSGVPQDVIVDVVPGGTVPLHTHSVDATMIILSGGGEVLSGDETINGRQVRAFDIVFFERMVSHGFRAASSGLTFLSRNGGIVDSDADEWDISFEPDTLP